MANLLLEGFDHYPATYATSDEEAIRHLHLSGWTMNGVTATSGGQTFTTETGRYGTGLALKHQSSGTDMLHPLNIVAGSEPTEVFMGFAFRMDGYNQSSGTLSLCKIGGYGYFSNPHLQLSIGADGSLVVYRDLAVYLTKTTDFRVTPNVWHYLEWRATIHQTTGSMDIKVDGVNVLSETGLDTQHSTTYADIRWIGFGIPTGGKYVAFDDVYVNDSTGSAPFNTYLGEISIETLRPAANGFQNDFTASPAVSNYLNVDDSPQPDNDTTYVVSSTNGDIESYTVSALSITWDTVLAVQTSVKAKRMSAGPAKLLRQRVRSVAADFLGSDVSIPADYVVQRELLLVDPNTSSAWTPSAVNAMQIGFEVRS